MNWRETHLILNPTAGRGRALGRRDYISRFLRERGVKPVWHVTDGPGHAGRIVQGLPEDSLAVAVGGDGTVHEVAAACVGTERTMAVLPAGSGNDYVKALGAGTHLRKSLEVISGGGKVRIADAGEVNGILFNNGLGIGFDAEVAAGVSKANPGGWAGSVGTCGPSLRLLAGFGCHEATLRLDGDPIIEAKTILVAAALGTTYGGGFRLAPDARLDDGFFDVVWSEEVSRAEVLRLIPLALWGTLPKHPKVHVTRAREVEVDLAEEIPAHIDGELLAPTRHFEARASALPGALRVETPWGRVSRFSLSAFQT